MKNHRAAFLCFVASLFSAATAMAQDVYPSKLVRLVVPFAVGGSTDSLARTVAAKLQERWKQPVIVENWVGGNGVVGTEKVAKVKPDGYTFLIGTVTTHAVAQSLYPKLPYNVERDFTPITELVTIPQLLSVRTSLPINSFKELMDYAKAHPGDLTYLGGTGQAASMSMALLTSRAGVKMLEVPYIGAAQGMTALLGGQIDAAFDVIMTSLPHLQAGRIRTLATTSSKRHPLLPQIPTIAESGFPGFESNVWFGLFAPAGTPPEIVKKISEDTRAALTEPETRKKLEGLGFEIVTSSPADFGVRVKSDIEKWRKVIKDANIKAD